MRILKLIFLTVFVPLVSACGGGAADEGQHRAPDMSISGLLLWDRPIAGATVEIQCNQNEQLFVVQTNGFGQFSARIPATKNVNIDKDHPPHCIFRSQYTTVGGLKRSIESNVTDYSVSGVIFANMNAVTSIWNAHKTFFWTKLEMDSNNFRRTGLGGNTFIVDQVEIMNLFDRDFYFTRYPGMFPEGYKDTPFAMSFYTYKFELQSTQAQAIMDFASDLDNLFLAPSMINRWQPITHLDNGDPVVDLARMSFPELSEAAVFEKDELGIVTVELSKGDLTSLKSHFIEGHFPTDTGDNRSRNVRVTLRYPDGTLYKRAEAFVFGFRAFKVELGPQFELEALAPGTILHVFFDGFAFGYSQIKI